MKVNAIKAICKDTNFILIMNDLHGRQWLGTHDAVYAVEPGLVISEKNIYALFDFTEAEANGFRIQQIDIKDERYRNRPMPGEGEPCKQYPLMITAMGGTFMALGTPEGVLFLDAAMVKPIERKNVPLEYYVREEEDKALLLAVYRDMAEVAALVKPMPMNLAEDLLSRLHGAFGNKPARDTKDKAEGGEGV